MTTEKSIVAMDLLPCPFCGGTNVFAVSAADDYGTFDWKVSCEDCDPFHETEAEAIAAWNRREVAGLVPNIEPDWQKAPRWAQWFAIDANGVRSWYEQKPNLHEDDGFWMSLFGESVGSRGRAPTFPQWQESLRERPSRRLVGTSEA